MASEVLGEVSPLHDKIVDCPELLSQFFGFLDEEELDATLVAYFCKVLVAMISRSPEKFVEFLASSGKLQRIALHTSHRGFYDVGLKILILDNIQYPSILPAQCQLISDLIHLLTHGKQLQVLNSSHIIIDLISRSCENLSKDLIDVLINDTSIQTLFTCLQSADSFQVVASLNILKTLLQANLKVSLKTVTDHYFSGQVFKSNLALLIQILLKTKTQTLTNTMKLEYEPLGEDRLKVIELVSILIRIPDDNLIQVLIDSGIFATVHELFFSYPWHSLLHNIIENIVAHVINSENEVLIHHFLLKGEFLQRVVQVCIDQQGKHRYGLLGVLHKIANMLKNSANPLVFESLAGNEMWLKFVAGYLEKRNRLDYLQLGEFSRKVKSASSESFEIQNESDEDKRNGEGEGSVGKVNEEAEGAEDSEGIEGKGEKEREREREENEEKAAGNEGRVTLEICVEENDFSADALNRKSPLAKRRHSGGQISPCGNADFHHANFWNVPILVDELDGLELE